jgi:hypothetical protein
MLPTLDRRHAVHRAAVFAAVVAGGWLLIA